MAASPQPNDDDAEVQAHVAAALDDGLGGSALLSRLHEAKPSLNMEAMQAALKTAQKTEDARLFDLIAENYRDFFSLAQSLDTSAEECSESRSALLALHGEVSKQAGLRAHERRGLEDELKRRRADRRDRLERAPSTASAAAVELEADLGAADVAVERCAHASLALRAQLDGAVDFVRDGALACSSALAAFLAAAFTQGRLDGVERGSCSGLATIFRATLEFVAERAGRPAAAEAAPLATAPAEKTAADAAIADWRRGAGAADRSLHGVDLVCHGVWAPVCAALGGLDGVFDLGNARRRTDVAASAKFADDLAALAASGDRALARRVRRRLKAHPATATLEERWNLPVYFELVRGDLVRDLDDALAATYVLVDGPRRGPPEVSDRVASALGVVADASLDLDLATADAVAAGARAALAPGRRLRAAAAERLEAALAAAAVDRLRAVKGVPATYHLTGRPPPGAPSRYVSDALAPGAAFAGDWGGHLADARGRGARRRRRDDEGLVLDVLDQAARFEATMAKRNKHADVAGDALKIAAQLALDVDAFAAGSGLDAAATFPRAKAAIAAVLAPN
ncbi:hypothetical protein JL720_16602 [Aureococcus anophagefferens]|nr:hypothetical protein JL720_16602 [Aureococcus anophagefferens]